MRREKGAALIVVLTILIIVSLLALSSMNSSIVSERLAGNYKLHTQAEMNSESSASHLLNSLNEKEKYTSSLDSTLLSSCPRWKEIKELAQDEEDNCELYDHQGDGYDGVACHINLKNELCGIKRGRYIIAVGAVIDNNSKKISEGSTVFVGFKDPLFKEPVHGCEGVNLTGSATITGGVVSGGNIDLSEGGIPPDSAKAHEKVNYPSWWIWDQEKMRIAENYEDGIYYNHSLTDPDSSCDPIKVKSILKDLEDNIKDVTGGEKTLSPISIGSYPKVWGTISSDGISVRNEQSGEVENPVSVTTNQTLPGIQGFEGSSFHVIRTGNFTQHNGGIRVTGDKDYLLLVDGDFTLGSGGNESLVIEEGSTLTVVVTGAAHLDTALDMKNTPLTTDGKPTFSIYSTKEDAPGSSSFLINQDTSVTGYIYAPFSNIRITGGSVKRGAIRGRTISVSGASKITNEDNNPEGNSKSNTPLTWTTI